VSAHAYLLGGRLLHFPFLSGVLRYECSTCDAPCCKGSRGASLGIGTSKELVTISQVQAKAALFAVPAFHHSPITALQAPAERCWFLDKKTQCRLEKALGRDAKPAGCRLFPFVTFRSAGEAVVVLPDFLCPLSVNDAVATHGKTSHDTIALEIHSAHVPRSGHPMLQQPRDASWADAMPLERKIVDEGEPFLRAGSYVPFAELQHALALATLGVVGRAAPMAKVEDTIRRFLDVKERASLATVRDLVGVTGTLRMIASGLPRREMAGVLVALSVLAGVAEHMRGATRSARMLTSMFQAQLPFFYTLAHLRGRPTVSSDASLATIVRDLGAVRPALLPVLQDVEKNGRRNVAATLEDILYKQKRLFDAPLSAEAVAMLSSLGHVLMRGCTFVPL
jgi:Fe-S-cluster containining protein